MDFDPAVIIPAILFTVAAIYFASTYLNKKAAAAPAEKKKPKVGYADIIPPSRALGVVQHYEPKVEKPPVIEHKPEVAPPKEEPVIVAPVVEDIGVVEEQPEPEIIPVYQETDVKNVPEPEPVPEVVAEPIAEPVVEAEPMPEAEPEAEEAPAPAPEEPLPELIPGSMHIDEPAPEPMMDVVPGDVPELDAYEHNDVAAAEDHVSFTPGKKQSKFETLMTKEEMEEEQRVAE